ncbi:hypothetical protein [Rhodococcus sp. HNM0569]|uniref:hypothetical protein n=1 Tax=Rhodococcus sp. HNM0569 TaxID=2716340 RepID=UPI00146DB16E|nr:hypothetical protein [Rhodococcus sp. HNM0569]NLU84631.1 hypothetical protein [Rhodococcus sp. HNM0569]
MTRHLIGPVVALIAVCALASCGTDDADQTYSVPTRSADDRILAVDDGAECDRAVVEYTEYNFRLDLVVHGQEGDWFRYEITSKDGTVQNGASPVFDADTRSTTMATGIETSAVEHVTVTAEGTVGVPGQCTLTLPSA